MSSPYFRQFPELPAELRLQIWQEACLAFPPSRRGLQSASFLNGGLWKACKESRRVIAAYTEYHKWLEIHRRPVWDTRELVRHPPPGPPAIIEYDGEDEEECRMLVHPSSDMFCIKVDDWQSIRRGYHPDIRMPFICSIDDDEDDLQLRSRNRCHKRSDLQHIALEFDPSWVTDIPDSYLDMKRENSARGYLVDWLYTNANINLCDESLPIIDKEAKWIAKRPVKIMYRDFDTEYVKISWSAVADTSYEGLSPSAAAFMNKICHYRNDIYPDRESSNGWVCSWGPYFEVDINLVVRRDNEVKETIWGCPGECDRDGWCICSSDETKRRQERLAQRVES